MADERFNSVSSRMNLKIYETKLSSVKKGFSLLKCKSEALQLRYKELDEKVKVKEELIYRDFKKCLLILSEAELLGADVDVFANFCCEHETSLNCKIESICGIPQAIFSIERNEFEKEVFWRGGHKLKEAKLTIDLSINQLIELCQEKSNLSAIKQSFETANKRKNSLEHKMIPKLQATVQYIDGELDEIEREEFFRLKKIQEKKFK